MARETDADVYEPWWVQGCADPEHLGPTQLSYKYVEYLCAGFERERERERYTFISLLYFREKL